MAHQLVPTLSTDLAFFVVVALGYANGVCKGEYVVGVFGFVPFVPVTRCVEGFGIVVPGWCGVWTVAAKEEFDHVAFD